MLRLRYFNNSIIAIIAITYQPYNQVYAADSKKPYIYTAEKLEVSTVRYDIFTCEGYHILSL